MKWLIVVINLIVLMCSVTAIAKHEKIIKKPLGLKPTKAPKTAIDELRNLSTDDVEFLKQVEKQFKVHGDKIKIKVERENSTVINKNIKRTIEGSLGYGYRQNQHHGYYFSEPHVMHQFTTQDVPGEKGGYREKATDIEIQQSHSFEIKDPELHKYQQAASQNYQHEQVYEDPVPVIVLRIPGPQKYALHLQALLQQYLEIRAAQYIQALQDQERHGPLMNPHHYVAQQHQQHHHHMQYVPMYTIAPTYHHHQAYYQQQQQPQLYQHFYQTEVHHGGYPTGGEQSYYQQPQLQHHAQVHQQEVYQQPEIHQQQEVQEFHHVEPQQQQEYPTSFISFVTPAYQQEDLHQEQPQHNEELETVENYPSDKHTQVIFKRKKNRNQRPGGYHHSKPIVVAEPPAQHHQEEQVHHNHQPEHSQNHYLPEPQHQNRQTEQQEYPVNEKIVAVTQRSSAPFNYHVAQPTLAPTHEELQERHNPKRMAPFTKEQFEKARRMMMHPSQNMNKSKRNRGSTREKPTAAP